MKNSLEGEGGNEWKTVGTTLTYHCHLLKSQNLRLCRFLNLQVLFASFLLYDSPPPKKKKQLCLGTNF